MAVLLKNFGISNFRGINNLSVEHLNHVNVIAGDNNCGKTSVLEALLLLRNPVDITNVLRVARMRDVNIAYNGSSAYENFINLFPPDRLPMEIGLDANLEGQYVSYKISGEQKTIMLDPYEINRFRYAASEKGWAAGGKPAAVEAEAFSGTILFQDGSGVERTAVELHAFTRVTGMAINKNHYINMAYLAPMDHVHGNVFGRILRNESYKEICIQILKLFDPGIKDLVILKNEENNRPVECIRHQILGTMPLSTYGDGIKKVLSLANGIVQASDGILLIDEIETAIHSRYYEDIFGFLVKACLTFHVQLFVTTHSIEAIDGLLAAQDYDNQGESDFINVITLKKEADGQKTYSRVMAGRDVYTNREEFGFEVRL